MGAGTIMLGLLLLPSALAASTCYFVDGSSADSTHAPCTPDAKVSACCALNKDQPDICLSSGLCLSQEKDQRGFVYSNGCTDQSGHDAACPHVCPDRTYPFLPSFPPHRICCSLQLFQRLTASREGQLGRRTEG